MPELQVLLESGGVALDFFYVAQRKTLLTLW